MKTLIYGAGVVGCTYGWQLTNAGCDVTLLVRKGKAKKIENEGIHIACSDYRDGQEKLTKTIFRPKVIEDLSCDNDFDYIIISVASADLLSILPNIATVANKAHIIFFLNLLDEFDAIDLNLDSNRYSFGFPFMAGGGRTGNRIHATISGSKYSKTMIGNADGGDTSPLKPFARSLEDANLKPFISDQIVNWLVPHYVFIAAISAGIIKSGGTMKHFLSNKQMMKDSVKAIREGFNICSKREIDPRKEKVNQLYYLPFFICIPVMRKIFSNKDMASMFDGYLQHAGTDIQYMLDKVIRSAEKHGINTPYLLDLRDNIKIL